MSMLKTVLLLHAGATLIMTGVIWIVQVVHYPLFARVGAEGFAGYQNAHSGLITLVVMPAMLVELGTAAWLVVQRPAQIPLWLALAGLGLVGILWLSTFFVQVPQHGALARGFDADAHRSLVNGNWIRTTAWSIRSLIALWMVGTLMEI
jgi:hypothetical protein